MATKQGIFGLIDTGREVRRPPLIGMDFLHQSVMSAPDLFRARPRLEAKDLIGLLLRHWPAARRPVQPRCRITLSVVTPGGIPAVQIRCK